MLAPRLRAERLIMNKKEDIIKMIKNTIKRRKEWQTEEKQREWLYKYDTNDILYYVSGRFPEMTVNDLTNLIAEIKDDTNYYETLLKEVYENE